MSENKEQKEKKVSPLANLDPKTKFLYIFLCIITLSIFYFYVKHKIKKAKEKQQPKKQEKENKELVNEAKKESEPTKQELKPKQKTTKVTSTTPLKDKTKTKKVDNHSSSDDKNKNSIETNKSSVENLKVSNKFGFDISLLIEALGNAGNITSVEASLSSLKVMVKDKQLVNQEKIKSLGAKGLMISGQKVSIIFGDNSNAVKEALMKSIS